MIKKTKAWMIEQFLPQWAKAAMLEENQRLREQVEALKQENNRLNAYIEGYEAGVKAHRRIIINTAAGAGSEAGR